MSERQGLHASGRLIGSHRWWELAAFELLGTWVARVADPPAKVLLDRHSAHCAWRAAQWADRLPVLADVDRDGLVQPPDPPAAAAVEAMRGLGQGAGDADVICLAAAYRVVLARRAAAYQTHGEQTSPVADAAVRRTLGQVGVDVAADWAEGEARLQTLLSDERVVGVAAGCVAALESILAG